MTAYPEVTDPTNGGSGNEGEADDFVEYQAFRQQIRDKILHSLSIWPKISPSMLQVAIGTAVSPKIWHPILEQLIDEKLIRKYEVHQKSHLGRDQVYTIIALVE